MEYVRLPRVTVSDYLTNTNVRQLFASRANIVSERRWRRFLFEDASTLQFAKHSPPNTLNVRTNIHELFGQTCSTKFISLRIHEDGTGGGNRKGKGWVEDDSVATHANPSCSCTLAVHNFLTMMDFLRENLTPKVTHNKHLRAK
ncbi:hypothetical protein J6590_071224 [Homalodisca vitripennis]|nr:hypothetical protein J6590_071224 [Homalodisca vitripennis]